MKARKPARRVFAVVEAEKATQSQYFCSQVRLATVYSDDPSESLPGDRLPYPDGAYVKFGTQRDWDTGRPASDVYAHLWPRFDDELRQIERALPLARKALAVLRKVEDLAGAPHRSSDVLRRIASGVKLTAVYVFDASTHKYRQTSVDSAVSMIDNAEHEWRERRSLVCEPAKDGAQ